MSKCFSIVTIVLKLFREYFSVMENVLPFAMKRCKNLGPCSASTIFKEERIFIVPHLLWQGTSVIAISSEVPPQFSSLERQARGTWVYSRESGEVYYVAIVFTFERVTSFKQIWISCTMVIISEEEDFLMSCMYLNISLYILSCRRAWPFIWTNLNLVWLTLA